MELYLNGLIRSSTPELIAFRKEFEDNYDDLEYLDDLFYRVQEYAESTEFPIREAYVLMDEIDERELELKNGI